MATTNFYGNVGKKVAGKVLGLRVFPVDKVTTTEASNTPLVIGIVAGVIALLVIGILVYFCYWRKKKALAQGLESVSVGGSTQSSTGTGTTTGTVKSGTKKTVSKY
uniref:Mid2 domain-containing protein n=1 Tax=Caenorhabditis tropicalis TaxID=1561998 RepID=A0A1I7UV95_9PELO